LVKDRLFFVVSGEHRTLPHAEIRAILQSHGIDFSETAASTKLLRVKADCSALDVVARRSVMYEQCGFEITATNQGKKHLLSILSRMYLRRHFAKRRSFAVRSIRVGGASRYLNRANLERDIGGALKERSHGVQVDLDHPDVTFLCVVSSRGLMLGRVAHSRTPGMIASRRPRKRPVFHPSTMQPKLARCVVNLSRPPEGATLLDPFCGVGGILLEAAAIGCRAIGADADARMIRGARTNLAHYGAEPFGLIVADATRVPIRAVGSIVTDPPYGREASTRGRRLHGLMREFLPKAHSVLTDNGHLCICCPSSLRVMSIAERAGFKLVESHLLYVHRSLTRRILVLRKR
jgi:tRNA (guanine10-N2)-dimethyltransferase